MTTKINEDNIQQNTLNTITGGIKVTSVVAIDGNGDPLDPNEISTSGGNVKITGTGFRENSQVHIEGSSGSYILATSITFVSSTELTAALPATSAGTYNLFVTRNDGAFALKINGVTFA